MSKIHSMSFWLELNGFEYEKIDSSAIASVLSVKVEEGRIEVPENFIYSDANIPVF